MLDILKSVYEIFSKLFDQFPNLVSSKYFWICISVFAGISGLFAYFMS